MTIESALIDYAHALGRSQSAWRFASSDLRRATAFAVLSEAWEVFKRDAGPGTVGRNHERAPEHGLLLQTDDPRRDALLLWLADSGARPLRDAATIVVAATGAQRRFDPDNASLIDVALNALSGALTHPGPLTRALGRVASSDGPLAGLSRIVCAIDLLRLDVDFLEAHGGEVRHTFPNGTFAHYVPADPGAGWALNVALLGNDASEAGAIPVPGLASRAQFREDDDPDVLLESLIVSATTACARSLDRMTRLAQEIERGHQALDHLSRNARARDAWTMVASLGTMTRTQIARSLGLSRAGADIQVHALAKADLATIQPLGRVSWRKASRASTPVASLEEGPLGAAIAEVDQSLEEIDRLLARTSR